MKCFLSEIGIHGESMAAVISCITGQVRGGGGLEKMDQEHNTTALCYLQTNLPHQTKHHLISIRNVQCLYQILELEKNLLTI